MNSMTLAITALSFENYSIFTPITSSDKSTIVALRDKEFFKVFVREAWQDEKGSSCILRLENLPDNTSIVVATHCGSNEAWILKMIDIAGMKVVRLGKRWNCCKFFISSNPPTITLEADVLRANAIETSNKIKELLK